MSLKNQKLDTHTHTHIIRIHATSTSASYMMMTTPSTPKPKPTTGLLTITSTVIAMVYCLCAVVVLVEYGGCVSAFSTTTSRSPGLHYRSRFDAPNNNNNNNNFVISSLRLAMESSTSTSTVSAEQEEKVSPASVTENDVESSTADAGDSDVENIHCYVTNDDELSLGKDDKPEIVCTSEPEDYAWFNGIDPNKMRETDGTEEGTEECVEGYSHKGTPEWECK